MIFLITGSTSNWFCGIAKGLGLAEHPQVKQAILDRKRTIITQIRENWHNAALLAGITYLMEDKDIKQVIKDAKEDIIREIGEHDSLIDVTWLMMHLDWLRDDSAVVKAMERRILDKGAEFDYTSMKTLKEAGMFRDYPELLYALGTHGENIRSGILDYY